MLVQITFLSAKSGRLISKFEAVFHLNPPPGALNKPLATKQHVVLHSPVQAQVASHLAEPAHVRATQTACSAASCCLGLLLLQASTR